MESAEKKLPSPILPAKSLRADHVANGPKILPDKIVTLYSDKEWEEFIREWCESLTGRYVAVERLGGANDQGRDVVALTKPLGTPGPWDNYQCKHYQNPLTPTDVYIELAKLCFYTWKGEFTVPRAYFFVAPRDVGTSLWKLFEKPTELKKALIDNWDKYCRDKITNVPVLLETGLAAYVNEFDFGIISYYQVRKVIEEHKGTAYHVVRFGGGLPDRPKPALPPAKVADIETRYVRQLLDAYGDCQNCEFDAVGSLPDGVHRRHFDRSREDFYRAESLSVFSRASVPAGTFEELQQSVFKGVIDVAESQHNDGFVRVKETAKIARQLTLQTHPLVTVVTAEDKSGVCHQLANEDRLIWVPKT